MGVGDAWTPGFEVTLRVPTGDPGKTLPSRLVPNVSVPTHRVNLPQKREKIRACLEYFDYTSTYCDKLQYDIYIPEASCPINNPCLFLYRWAHLINDDDDQ